MRFFSKKPGTSEPPVRPDQVNRLTELMGQELMEEITECPSPRDLNRAQALLSAAERNSSQAEINEASRRSRLF
jgi:hypothetical protein